MIRIEVILAWPRRHASAFVALDDGASVADAIAASGLDAEGIDGVAVFGVRVERNHVLAEGDRVELLRPLLVDPKDARRRRAIKP